MGWTTDHVVTLPDRSHHRAVKIGDAMLLLIDPGRGWSGNARGGPLPGGLRGGQRIIAEAGGIAKWM